MQFVSDFVSFWQSLLGSMLLLLGTILTGTPLSSSTTGLPSQTNIEIPARVYETHSTTTSATTISGATSTKTTTSKNLAATPPTHKAIVHTETKVPLPPLLSPDEVNTRTRRSIVNILCTTAAGGPFRPISGSGVIIDPRGVILTNAHIGQYFLLRDYPSNNSVECTIRTGSPASPLYRAVLLYLPPAWIDGNASQITAEHGLGTGENDYAFLLITEPTDPNSTLPASYINISLSGATPDTGDGILVAGYPAGFLDGITIEKSLYATSAFSTVGQLYAFAGDTFVDVISLGGTVVSQGGSSGGAVVSTYDSKLVGLIATATTGSTTASRDLRAITMGHIDRSLRLYGKGGLAEFLSGNLVGQAADFATNTFDSEKQKLLQVINPAR